ncbi:hypothetical protein OUZ56_030156 [Daphnia magna]|uniref:Uncharacterized protein n=1 Tax=Daphnia magna TaxID=35525 RepID=A0ABQ9ZQF7_9CRUS|nr:hypothetical protein OUZ56_030156 [Daphnia magna]
MDMDGHTNTQNLRVIACHCTPAPYAAPLAKAHLNLKKKGGTFFNDEVSFQYEDSNKMCPLVLCNLNMRTAKEEKEERRARELRMSLAQVVREPLCNHEAAEPSHYETGIKSERKQQEFLKLRRTRGGYLFPSSLDRAGLRESFGSFPAGRKSSAPQISVKKKKKKKNDQHGSPLRPSVLSACFLAKSNDNN